MQGKREIVIVHLMRNDGCVDNDFDDAMRVLGRDDSVQLFECSTGLADGPYAVHA